MNTFRSHPDVGTPATTDLDTAAAAASVENLNVRTYQAALEALSSGALGDVPVAVGEFVTTAQAHHQAALEAWNWILTANGRAAVTSPPSGLETTTLSMFSEAKDVAGLGEIMLWLEEIAAATHLSAITTLQSPEAIALAGSIQPIERQHIAVLRFILGSYPVPDTFAGTALAYTPAGVPAPAVPPTR